MRRVFSLLLLLFRTRCDLDGGSLGDGGGADCENESGADATAGGVDGGVADATAGGVDGGVAQGVARGDASSSESAVEESEERSKEESEGGGEEEDGVVVGFGFGWGSGGSAAGALQSGHTGLTRIHWSKQSAWKQC